jgi:transcriptional regulator with XRE-family HTH domain
VADPSRKLGARIRTLRKEAGLSLTALAERADVSKGYLWTLERGETKTRPSGETLHRIAKALGTTIADLLGRSVEPGDRPAVPGSLRKFAQEAKLSERDMLMLARVNFRGQQPRRAEDWEFIWQAIRRSVEQRPERR